MEDLRKLPRWRLNEKTAIAFILRSNEDDANDEASMIPIDATIDIRKTLEELSKTYYLDDWFYEYDYDCDYLTFEFRPISELGEGVKTNIDFNVVTDIVQWHRECVRKTYDKIYRVGNIHWLDAEGKPNEIYVCVDGEVENINDYIEDKLNSTYGYQMGCYAMRLEADEALQAFLNIV